MIELAVLSKMAVHARMGDDPLELIPLLKKRPRPVDLTPILLRIPFIAPPTVIAVKRESARRRADSRRTDSRRADRRVIILSTPTSSELLIRRLITANHILPAQPALATMQMPFIPEPKSSVHPTRGAERRLWHPKRRSNFFIKL